MSQPDEKKIEAGERVDPKLLEVLVCPLTKTTLQYDAAAQELISRAAGLAFPIRSGVPLMTIEAARHLDERSPPGAARSPER
ncbi:Trm112 family protein [Methylocystis sp.]|uniref:Trm112 family protein n=1 Tax=Methylocystis sp. TaxID=1911079 RepID=UPI003DA52D01